MENPIKMKDLGGTTIFVNIHLLIEAFSHGFFTRKFQGLYLYHWWVKETNDVPGSSNVFPEHLEEMDRNGHFREARIHHKT